MDIKDVAGVSEPLKALIKALRDGAGAVYEPTRIRRRAAAEADARLISARAEADAADLSARSNARIQAREARRQRNIDTIVEKAIPLLPAIGAGPPDEDWIAEFINCSEDVANETMQTLWARILAGEVARPRSFSRRTLQAIRAFSKQDADLFTRFCSYIWWFDDAFCHYAPHGIDAEVFGKEGLNFSMMLHLHSIGLISEARVGGIVGVTLALEPGSHRFQYHEAHFEATIPSETGSRALSVIPLTVIGQELVLISGASPSPAYLEYCLKSLREGGIEVRETTNEPNSR